MRSVPLSEAKDKLSALVGEAGREHEIIRVTRHGHGAAVLMSEDDIESLRETVFRLSQSDIREDVIESHEAFERGKTLSAEDVRARYGLPEA